MTSLNDSMLISTGSQQAGNAKRCLISAYKMKEKCLCDMCRKVILQVVYDWQGAGLVKGSEAWQQLLMPSFFLQ